MLDSVLDTRRVAWKQRSADRRTRLDPSNSQLNRKRKADTSGYSLSERARLDYGHDGGEGFSFGAGPDLVVLEERCRCGVSSCRGPEDALRHRGLPHPSSCRG